MNNIITKNIGAHEFEELCECIKECIRQSIHYSGNEEKISWFKDCTMDEYFYNLTDIYDEFDVKVGEGLDTIDHKFVLNDDTHEDFEKAFEQARDNAYEEAVMNAIDAIQEVEDFIAKIEVINITDSVNEEEQILINNDEISLSTIIARRIDEVCEGLEFRGYKKVATDNLTLTEFQSVFLHDIHEESNLRVEDIAKYFGATIKIAYQGSEYFDYEEIYYKKEGLII